MNRLAAVEYLPAQRGAAQELVLLHGWGADRAFWRPLLRYLRPWGNVTLLDVHHCMPEAADGWEDALDETLENILALCPQRAIVVGFSLGGKLAVELARRSPQRVTGVVTLCTNPCFVATSDWPGMAPADFDNFRGLVQTSPTTALKRFDALQANGARDERNLLRKLRSLRAAPAANLDVGLDWLASLEQRQTLADLAVPQCHFFALSDALVPAGVADSVAALLPVATATRVERFAAACHLLPWEQPAAVAKVMQNFLADNDLLGGEAAAQTEVSKADVAASFSRAAGHYDSVALLQQDVGRRLLASLDELQCEPQTILDLGCGTGYFAAPLQRRFPAASYLGLDIAQGMVCYAREHCEGSPQWLVGDAEDLPLRAGSVDLVFSSLALQWCYQPRQLFAEIARVLSPNGKCVFTSLGPGTLHELRDSWSAVDTYQHVNSFLSAADLASAAGATAGISLVLERENVTMEYHRVRDLLDELKALGAHNMNRSRHPGLTGRRALAGMLQAYESWRRNGLLPATYEVIFGTLEGA